MGIDLSDPSSIAGVTSANADALSLYLLATLGINQNKSHCQHYRTLINCQLVATFRNSGFVVHVRDLKYHTYL